MVELVVVVAIIGLMAAIAIPSFARMGLLWRNDLQASARELYTLLRAAKIYATTYNTETALVFSTYTPEGSIASANLRAAAVMYQHPARTFTDEYGDVKHLFVPVAGRDEGLLRTLPGNTGLNLNVFPEDRTPGCLEAVRVLFPDTGEQSDFEAVIFEASGRLRKDGREFYQLHVCYTADAGVDERLVDPALGENPDNYRTIDINLYRATGRVEIASD